MNQRIPFYPASSTTRSHNVGVNIQEVMGARRRKERHKGGGTQSPLKVDKSPINPLISNICEQTSYSPPQKHSLAPYHLNYGDYQDIHSLFTDISEEVTIIEDKEDVDDSMTVVLSGPSGDTNMENKNRQQVTFKLSKDGNLRNGDTQASSPRSRSNLKMENKNVQTITRTAKDNKTYTSISMSNPTANCNYNQNKIKQPETELPVMTKKLIPKVTTKIPEKFYPPLKTNTYQQIYGTNHNILKSNNLRSQGSRTFDTMNDKPSKKAQDEYFYKDTELVQAMQLSSQTVDNVKAICRPMNGNTDVEDTGIDLKPKTAQNVDNVAPIRQTMHDGTKEISKPVQGCQTNVTKEEIDALFYGVKDLFNCPNSSCVDDRDVTDHLTEDFGNFSNIMAIFNDMNNNQPVQPHNNMFKGKENLQRVLVQLHDDFDQLNRRYDYLMTLSTRGGYMELQLELERLDMELTKKEEEIVTILSLCKEIIMLRHHMALTKDFSGHKDHATSMSYDECKRLLRGVRHRSDVAILPFS